MAVNAGLRTGMEVANTGFQVAQATPKVVEETGTFVTGLTKTVEETAGFLSGVSKKCIWPAKQFQVLY